MVLNFSNFPDELSENDELREYELSGSDSICFCFDLRRLTVFKVRLDWNTRVKGYTCSLLEQRHFYQAATNRRSFK